MLVIGSRAMAHHGILDRATSCDVDLISTISEYEEYTRIQVPDKVLIDEDNKKAVQYGGIIVEFDIAMEGDTNMELLELYNEDGGMVYAEPSLLLYLKMSHKFKKDSPHFHKTMADIKHMRAEGVRPNVGLLHWYRRRCHETYNYAHPSLNVSKDDFFKDDEVPYVYDHDSIHTAVARLGKPAYNFIKPDESEVMCSKEMFDNASETVKLLTVYEESCVLALERSLVPYPTACPDEMFRYALMKVCTSITSGWWRAWAWDHHDEVIELHTKFGIYSYKDLFNEAVEKDHVRLFKEGL